MFYIQKDLETQLRQVEFLPKNCNLHSGFYDRFESSWESLYEILRRYANDRNVGIEELKITVTGHSMGGAVVNIAGLYLKLREDVKNLRVITIAAPRAADKAAAEFYDSLLWKDTVRVDNSSDLITMVAPGFMGYKHVGRRLKLGFGAINGHEIENYIDLIRNTKPEDFKLDDSVSPFHPLSRFAKTFYDLIPGNSGGLPNSKERHFEQVKDKYKNASFSEIMERYNPCKVEYSESSEQSLGSLVIFNKVNETEDVSTNEHVEGMAETVSREQNVSSLSASNGLVTESDLEVLPTVPNDNPNNIFVTIENIETPTLGQENDTQVAKQPFDIQVDSTQPGVLSAVFNSNSNNPVIQNNNIKMQVSEQENNTHINKDDLSNTTVQPYTSNTPAIVVKGAGENNTQQATAEESINGQSGDQKSSEPESTGNQQVEKNVLSSTKESNTINNVGASMEEPVSNDRKEGKNEESSSGLQEKLKSAEAQLAEKERELTEENIQLSDTKVSGEHSTHLKQAASLVNQASTSNDSLPGSDQSVSKGIDLNTDAKNTDNSNSKDKQIPVQQAIPIVPKKSEELAAQTAQDISVGDDVAASVISNDNHSDSSEIQLQAIVQQFINKDGTAPSVQLAAPKSLDKNSGKKDTQPKLIPTGVPLVASKDSNRVNNVQGNSKQPSYPDKNNPAPQNAKSKLPVIAAAMLAITGVATGIAIAVYLEMLMVGIAVGACCLVAATIIYYYNRPSNLVEPPASCNRPSSLLEGSNVKPPASASIV